MGYMACGKTTFGRALARRLKLEFIDLDFYIEQRFRKTVKEIFAERGEEGFRKIEADMLREAGEFDNVLISCGGGTPCFSENMDYMLGRGNTIWLDTPIDRITARLVRNRAKRPLMANKSDDEIREAVEQGLAGRTPYYSRAQIRFSGELLEDKTQIDRTVDEFLGKHPMNGCD